MIEIYFSGTSNSKYALEVFIIEMCKFQEFIMAVTISIRFARCGRLLPDKLIRNQSKLV